MLTGFLFILGFIFLIKGADLLVEGSSAIAKKVGISDLVIGLTIVSFGTSAPELLVNIFASFEGAADIGIGNVVGSNIANVFLILGVAAVIRPLRIKKNTTWVEIPLNLLAALVLLVLANDAIIDGYANSNITRSDGIILMSFFCIFMYYTINLARAREETLDGFGKHGPLKASLMTIVGIIGLAYGGDWVVNGAKEIALHYGMSEALIGLTIIAVGTSLPELATSAVAAYKKNTDIAVGNVVGSNLFNIFWVLGLSAVIKPMPFNPAVNSDLWVYALATVLLFIFSLTGGRNNGRTHIQRGEGAIFVIAYVVYIVFIVVRG